MLSIDQNNLNSSQPTKYKDIFNKLENILKSIEYDFPAEAQHWIINRI